MKALACMLVLVIAVLSHATSASAAIIYSDDFSGSSGANLNGTAPDVRPGTQTWTAATAIKADGSVSGVGHASAYLPFNPVAGNVYTMSVDVNVTGGTGGNWFALGFAADDEIFGWHSTSANPTAWILARHPGQSDSQSFLGPNTGGDANHAAISNGNLKVVLDTTLPLWKVDWYINNVSVRSTSFTSNPTINYVGLTRADNAVGLFDNFSLSTPSPAAAVPEPSSLTLLAIGMVALGVWRVTRKNR